MQNTARSLARSMTVATLTAFAALVIGAMQSLTTTVTASLGLTAFQAIIVPGTGTPDPYALPISSRPPTRKTVQTILTTH
jgi:ABC-type spermidine/putrescine transport system permease subunit II